MSIDLIIEQPSWFLALCILCGLLFSYILYQRNIGQQDAKSKVLIWTQVVLRFLSVTFLALLILNPLLKYLDKTIEKPVVYLYVDNSESMLNGGDSAYVASQLSKDLIQFNDAVSEKYDVVELNGPLSSMRFNDVITDLSKPYSDIKKLYGGRNASAVVVVSDGIYNRGANPMFSAQQSGLETYTVSLGDTTIQKDISIYSAKTNSVTFLGNEFPVEVVMNASKCSGENVELSIWDNKRKLDSKLLKVSNERFTATHKFMVKANKVGNKQLTVKLNTINGEQNTLNNYRTVYTDVLDVKQKILLIAHSPHPDVAVLRNAISKNDQYELTVQIGMFDKLDKNNFDLIISHQLPVNSYEFNYLQSAKELKLPLLTILGTQTNVGLLNRLGIGIQINGNRRNFNQALASGNKGFSLFDLKSDLKDFLENAAPLTTPFGEYSAPAENTVLAYQKIGSVETKMPLWFFNNQEGYRTGVCTGEGIWRWRFNDFEENDNTDLVDGLLRKSIQYLALKDDKRKFKLYTSSRTFDENERISFIGEVYNDSYEFTGDATVTVQLTNDDGTTFDYTLVPQAGSYRYSVGSLPSGQYSFNATAQYNGKSFKENGSFVVRELQLESQNLTADYRLLNQLAEETGGQRFYKEEWSQLAKRLLEKPNAVSVVKESGRFKDLISLRWLFFIIFTLFGIEWFLRRWSGGY